MRGQSPGLPGLRDLLARRGFGFSPPLGGDVLREAPVRSMSVTLAECWEGSF